MLRPIPAKSLRPETFGTSERLNRRNAAIDHAALASQ